MNLDRIRSNTRQSPPPSPPPDPSSSVSPPCRRPSSATDRARRRSRRRDGTTVYVQRRVTHSAVVVSVGASILVTRDRARSFYSRYPADGSRSLREAVGESGPVCQFACSLACSLACLSACTCLPAYPSATRLPAYLSTCPSIDPSNLSLEPRDPEYPDVVRRQEACCSQRLAKPSATTTGDTVQVVSDLART